VAGIGVLRGRSLEEPWGEVTRRVVHVVVFERSGAVVLDPRRNGSTVRAIQSEKRKQGKKKGSSNSRKRLTQSFCRE
jgi:hypothetical protein